MNMSDIFLSEAEPQVRYGIKEVTNVKLVNVASGEEILILQSITDETRQESYTHVLTNLGERQRTVMTNLQESFTEGATAKELSNHLYANGLAPSPERNSVHPRLNELVEQGLVEVIGKKTCQFTNRKVAIYKSKI